MQSGMLMYVCCSVLWVAMRVLVLMCVCCTWLYAMAGCCSSSSGSCSGRSSGSCTSRQGPYLTSPSSLSSPQVLRNYYVHPICSPTRSALMTGRYPLHLGTQVRGGESVVCCVLCVLCGVWLLASPRHAGEGARERSVLCAVCCVVTRFTSARR